MKKKIIIIIAIAVVAVLAASIFFVYKTDRPDQKKMVSVFSDVYLLEAVIQQKGNLAQFNAQAVEECYHTLLAHHGLTKAEFDSTVAWFSRHPKEYSELNHAVIARLSSRETEFQTFYDRRDSIKKVINEVTDSIRLQFWSWPTTIRTPIEKTDTIDRRLRFDAEFDSLKGGRIYAKMKHVFPYRNPVKDSCEMRLIVAYNDSVIDTVSTTIKKKVSQQTVSITYNVCDTLWAHEAELTLLTSPKKDLDKTISTLSDIEFYYMPYEVTDSIDINEIVLPPLFSY